jgi:MFS family permease
LTTDGPAAQPEALGARAVLRIPDFRRIFGAQAISDFGDALTNLAVLLVVNQLTGSLAALAVMAIVLAVPQVTIGIFAGAWVDRWDPRKVMLVSDFVRIFLVLGMVLVHTADGIWILFVLGFLQSAVGTFFAPARITLVSTLVPRQGLMAANSLSQGARIVAMVLGTGGAGVLVSLLNSAWPAFVVDAGTFLLSFVLVLGVKARREAVPAADGAPAGSILREVREGIVVVARAPKLVATLISASAVMLGIGAVNVLFVPLLVNDLAVSPAWFGAIEGAQTVGMILAAALLATRLGGVKPSVIVGVSMAGLATATALLAGVTQVWQVIGLLFLFGWVVTPLQAAVTTLVQTQTEPQVRGRVAALLNSVVSGASIISMAFAGIAGQFLGVRSVFLLSAAVVGTGAVAAVVLFRRGDTEAPLNAPFEPAVVNGRSVPMAPATND